MRIDWAFNRLRTMEATEILHRIRERGRQILSKGRVEGWQLYVSPGPAPHLPGLGDRLVSLAKASPESFTSAASALLDGGFSALGQTWPTRSREDLFPGSFWRFDPVTHQLWPGAETYCFDIAYRHETTKGDIKYVWEANRLQFLQALALRVYFEQDEASLAAIETCVKSWHAANPPFRGIAWNSGIEIALRAISLVAVSSLVGTRLSPPVVEKLRAILNASLFWLQRFPSRYSSANNHLIAETTGEYLIALALPDLVGSGRIAESASAKLQSEAEKQFFGDGTPAEQSPSYGAFSAELLHTAHCAAPLGDKVLRRLQEFAGFVEALDDGSGILPAIGDDDEGHVLVANTRLQNHSHDVSKCSSQALPHEALKTFPQGGYTIFNDRRWHIVFDHGPLGYLSIAAHGHADALSMILSLDGRKILVDPGTYLYHSGGNWRDWFRGTTAHNTLSIAGMNQSRIAGPFNWLDKANATLEQADINPALKLVASHDGYVKRFGVTHRRTITGDLDAIQICDQLIGKESETVADIAFQLAANLKAGFSGSTCRISAEGRDVVELLFPSHGTVQIFYGAPPDAGGGWVSPAFGVKVEAPRIVWSGPVGARGVVTTIRALRPAGRWRR